MSIKKFYNFNEKEMSFFILSILLLKKTLIVFIISFVSKIKIK